MDVQSIDHSFFVFSYLEADDHERTWKFTQKDIMPQLDLESATKAFDLELSFGPYHVDFTRNGRYLLVGQTPI